MTYERALGYIHSQKRFGPKPGLDRMRKLLNELGNPQKKLRFVHIAGTNGKGSTTVMTARVLEQAGYRVGAFTSPFVVDFRDRFQINRVMVTKDELVRLVECVKPAVDRMNEAGETVAEFELVTALGVLWFYEKNCDVVCLEVGIGGRLDCTNVISPPLAAVITSVSYDHTDVLGNTLEEISLEKAGIIKRGADVVCYPDQPPEVVEVLMKRCAETGSRLVLPNAATIRVEEMTAKGTLFRYGDDAYQTKLVGEHQAFNAVTAIETIRLLQTKGFAVSEEQLREGLRNASIPTRFEVLRDRPMVVIDGAHNPGGAAALRRTLEALPKKEITAVIAMLKDKDAEELLRQVGPLCKKIVATGLENPRAIPPGELCETAKKYCESCLAVDSRQHALELAEQSAGENGMVLICGSLYLASEMRKLVLKTEEPT